MQTFLPYSSFSESAKCLDIKRLGKQRIETKEILVINLHILYPDKYDSSFVQIHMPDSEAGHETFYIYYLESKITTIPMDLQECIRYVDNNYKRLQPEIRQAKRDMKYNRNRGK